MPCFKGCFGKISEGNQMKNRRNSMYGVANEMEVKAGKTKNAMNIKLQMEMTEELSASTYGLTPQGVSTNRLEAQDFFTFKEIVGSGATGVVFRAVFKPTSEVFAVKFIPNFRQTKQMVVRELSVLKLCGNCRFLINFHSHFRVDINMYFVMELCEGGSLEELLEPKHVIPPKLGKVYIKELSGALFYLHSLKIVHRDVYLPNCVLTNKAHLKLCDFGLCRTIEDPQGELLTDCGKPCTRAPEIYLDRPCSFSIDWWSVGIVLYRFTTGYRPFQTDKLTQGYQSVTKLKEKYPEWLFDDPDTKDFCQKLLIKDPKRRLGSDNEVSDIKNHPYFFGVDWEEDEDIFHVIELDMQGHDIERYATVANKILQIVGHNEVHLSHSGRFRMSLTNQEKTKSDQTILFKINNLVPYGF
ncbi:protein kinase C-like 2 [Physella acuta]|uniref:protein kinase C-like 2 n=1 Tax=Physella acuta TaxID=109671 RepID=UPI0027DB953A|nr:protein kinase C-like 2 [Physella acuta]